MILNEVTMVDALRSWRGRRWLPSLMALMLDVLVVVLSIYLGWKLRTSLDWFDEARDVDEIARTAIVPMAAAWIIVLAICSAYSPSAMGAGTSEYRRVVLASGFTAGSIGVACYLLGFPLSRALFFMTFAVGLPLLLFGRYAVRRAVHRLHERKVLTQQVLLVGGPLQIAEVAKVLHRERWLGYDILGAALPASHVEDANIRHVPVLGSSERINALAHEWAPDIVMFVGGAVNSAAEMRRAAWGLEASGARIMIVPSLTDVASDRITVRPAGGLPMMELEGPASRVRAHVLKRSFDLVGGTLLLVLFSPLLLVTALAVKAHDGGPVLYRQIRAGRNGLPFGCYKFRSMVVDADHILTSVENDHGEDHILFKSKDDPRITTPGRFIRRFSIDELPQLLNVVHGSMSLVGPRPPLPSEVARYSSDVHRRLTVRPGMTGLWQISGRSDLSWEDTVRLDLYYVDNWSILRDIAILARTTRAVLSSRGAY
jgi:exopolysaccharide biosynthesis polyprenyl glycosylphosphotransferase